MRVLVIDAGMNCGFGALGDDGRPVVSGSRRLPGGPHDMGKTMRAADRLIRELILQERATVLGFASPFVGQVYAKPQFINGEKVWGKASAISPDALRPLFGIIAKIEEIADELRLKCMEFDEPQARRAFLTAVPRKSADIKLAVMRACVLRGWPAHDHHSADGLCGASWIFESLQKDAAHTVTPLFAVAPALPTAKKPRRKRL